jgi:uncharacterized protein YbbK (DUF523 family)
MDKILISSCLLGEPVRYDGHSKPLSAKLLKLWQQQQRLVPICPEMAGGLPCPRQPAEIEQGQGGRVLSGDARVLRNDGQDLTPAFIAGARQALDLCRQHRIRFALLKARSPSCGIRGGYDGTFSGTLNNDGIGVTAALLELQGIRVFNEQELEQLAQALDRQQDQP